MFVRNFPCGLISGTESENCLKCRIPIFFQFAQIETTLPLIYSFVFRFQNHEKKNYVFYLNRIIRFPSIFATIYLLFRIINIIKSLLFFSRSWKIPFAGLLILSLILYFIKKYKSHYSVKYVGHFP